MNLNHEQQDLVDFAYRINRALGAHLSVLFITGVVYPEKDWQYRQLVNHLETNKNFTLITGFDCNPIKRCVWLDTISKPLQDILKENGKIKWAVN
jgi:hypothetical protein